MAHLPDLGIHIGDDETHTYLLVSNGHTGNRTLIIAPTTIRVICQNTLRMAEAQARENRKHPGLAGGFTLKHTPGIHAAVAEASVLDEALAQQWQEHTHALLRLPRPSGGPTRHIGLTSTAFSYYAAYADEAFQAVVGNITLTEITKQHIRDFRDKLGLLGRYWSRGEKVSLQTAEGKNASHRRRSTRW